MSTYATAEEALAQLLLADVAVAALIGTRAYPERAPQTAPLPFVTIQRVDGVPEHNLDSASGLVTTRLQFDFWAAHKKPANELAEACRLVLEDYRGTVTVGAANVVIQDVTRDSDNTSFVANDDFSDQGLYRVSHDYAVDVEEAIPTH